MDGAIYFRWHASQYKNYKNFNNIPCYFAKLQFGCWMALFAMSQGKGPCDGIGCTIKRLAHRISLQSVNYSTGDIQTPLALFLFENTNIENINLFMY